MKFKYIITTNLQWEIERSWYAILARMYSFDIPRNQCIKNCIQEQHENHIRHGKVVVN